jgi:hypothetical protein
MGMRWLVVLGLVGCVVGDGGKARRWVPPEVLPETSTGSSWIAHVTDLRTQLARASIKLEMKVDQPVLMSTECKESRRRCVKCQLLDESDTVPGAALGEIAEAFKRYPAEVLENGNVRYVALCRKLFNGTGGDRMHPAGLADTNARMLFLSVDDMLENGGMNFIPLAQVVHHEVFHLLDRHGLIDDEWHGLNPSGFVYHERENEWTRPEGFVDGYGAKNSREDRAMVFTFMMERADELCELAKQDPIVNKKAKLLLERLAVLGDTSYVKLPCTFE